MSKRSRTENDFIDVTLSTLVEQLVKVGESERLKLSDKTVKPAYSVAFREVLDRIAGFLLNAATIVAGESVFVVREVEMYAKLDGVYEDRFTHCDLQQGIPATWYFHKKGGSYKAGSFKGLDVTFGNSTSGIWCGALIRSIQNTKTNELIEGPSLTVDAILAATKMSNIAALVGSSEYLYVDSESQTLYGGAGRSSPLLVLRSVAPTAPMEVLRAPRVGLVPRSDEDLLFAGRLLRFYPSGTKLKKQRSGVVAALLVDGDRKDDEIVLLSGCRKGMVSEIRALLTVADSQTLLGADVMQTPVIAGVVGYARKMNAL